MRGSAPLPEVGGLREMCPSGETGWPGGAEHPHRDTKEVTHMEESTEPGVGTGEPTAPQTSEPAAPAEADTSDADEAGNDASPEGDDAAAQTEQAKQS